MADFTKALSFLVEYLDLPEATGDPNATWETFQLLHLNNTALLAIENKARQVAWSWTAAAESMANAIMTPRSTSIFVSINQDEASEKIRYAKYIMEALDKEVRPRLLSDNKLELELDNGSRLISHPCRPVRGKAKAWVYLDEFAHYPNDAEIYQSALPVITKGGVVRIGSSPFGARGLFWEIFTESMRRFPGYTRAQIPWWAVRALCKDTVNAVIEAPSMMTLERVTKFGSDRLIMIFENMLLDDFQQEYECAWLDESVSWIDWDLIQRNQLLAGEDKLWYRKVSGKDAATTAIYELKQNIGRGIEDVFCAGVDIGRTHDTTEITILGKNSTNMLPYRLGITLDRVEFDDQEHTLCEVLDILPVSSMLIDQNGIGMQLAENMHKKYDDKALGVGFSSATKELWAVETKLRFQRGEVPLPLDRELAYQIHSIRKTSTDTNKAKFDTEGNEKHHADQFWALALAIWAARGSAYASSYGPNPTDGYRG